VLDRIERSPDGRVEYHFVNIDYLCYVGEDGIVRGSDAEDARWVAVDELTEYRVRENAIAVIMKAIEANRRRHL